MEVKKTTAIHKQAPTELQPAVFYRITALWALSEALLGGVLHALHLPGTGLFVGGASVLCISLLAHFCPSRQAILKATILVLIIKGILSPHTPPGAYLAVFIQGSLGYLLFWSKKYFKVSCLLLGVLTQLQSALQRLVVMLVVFGADLYQVADGLINYILKKAGFTEGDYVLYIVIAYLSLHLVMGVLVGWLAGAIQQKLKQQQGFPKMPPLEPFIPTTEITADIRKARQSKNFKSPIIAIVAIVIAGSLYFEILNHNTAYTLVVRAILIIMLWVWVISPFLQKKVLQWSTAKKSVLASELNQIFQLMPFIKYLVANCWASLSQHSLPQKLFLFPRRFTLYLLYC